MKALKEIGLTKAVRFIFFQFVQFILSILFIPQLRCDFLKLLGVKIGKNCIIYNVNFMNLYRGSMSNLEIGDNCFIGNGVLLDLAAKISIGDNTTISDRCILLTHMNVGYRNHPLQRFFPPYEREVLIGSGVFIGVGAIILPNIHIKDNVLVAAASVVTKDLTPNSVYAGSPAKYIKRLTL